MASTPADDASDRRRTDEPERTPVAGPDPAPVAEPGPRPVTEPGPATVAEPEEAPRRADDVTMSSTPTIKRTRISGTWVAVIVAAIVLIFLLVFILQNLTTATVRFLGLSGSLPLGVAMLFSAIAGAILVALIGTARILQLRKFAKRIGTTRWSPRRRS